MAKQLVELLKGEFDPKEYQDEYRQRVKEFVEKFWTQKVPFKLGLLTASAIDTRPADGQTGSLVKRPVVGNDAAGSLAGAT